jgi:hypothetical protein
MQLLQPEIFFSWFPRARDRDDGGKSRCNRRMINIFVALSFNNHVEFIVEIFRPSLDDDTFALCLYWP